MKILLFGGSGVLGSELLKIDPEIIAHSHRYADIIDRHKIAVLFDIYKPEIIINCAAQTDNRKIEKTPTSAIMSNIIGAANITLFCVLHNIRYVYISTDYVYPGTKGNYSETDDINPINQYAWTKLGGECSARQVKNHLIIRTSFCDKFPHSVAWENQYTSKEWVDIVAKKIYKASTSNICGVMNIGSQRKSMLEFARERKPDIKSAINPLNIDTSMISKYDEIK